MIRITTNVVLWKNSELQQPEKLRIILLISATMMLAFLVSPIVGTAIVGFMLWQSSRGSLTIDAAQRAAKINLQIGSNVANDSVEE
ncbi:MAG: hypothetical protein R3C17_08865 [Planctomycetaceae bacterium]